MSESTVAIVGSGIVGTAIAWSLTQRGHDVVMFEKGPEFPYPHEPQFKDHVLYLHPKNPKYTLPRDLKNVVLSGDYAQTYLDLDGEMGMVVGGSATHWGGVAVRMRPDDFRTRSKFGYGLDWPLSYEELEPYYCRAEQLIGVSGTDEDNPFAPPRSAPYPLPPFELAWDDVLLAEKLKAANITIHTTPQARTREQYDGRPGCMNFGVCPTCPVGVRYSPNHHLEKIRTGPDATGPQRGKVWLRSGVSVRRVIRDESGAARAVLIRENDSGREEEHAAKVIIVAGGALESARLLLLSGLGSSSEQIGRNLVFHHYYTNVLYYKEALWAGRLGPPTGQSQQFLSPPGREKGRHGGLKVDFHSWASLPNPWEKANGAEVLAEFEKSKRSKLLGLHAESQPSAQKYVALDGEIKDRFGDPFAHVHYDCSEFDAETHRYSKTVYDQFSAATGATGGEFVSDLKIFSSGSHHMGTCRMGADAKSGVVDSFGAMFGVPNLVVAGGSTFVGGSGGVHPTLTMVALALRAADRLLETTLKKAE